MSTAKSFWVLRVAHFANPNAPQVLCGQYLVAFDFDADGGLGFGTFSYDPLCAKCFESVAEAFAFWNTISTVRPTRDDGMPNRPLTSTTMEVLQIELKWETLQ